MEQQRLADRDGRQAHRDGDGLGGLGRQGADPPLPAGGASGRIVTGQRSRIAGAREGQHQLVGGVGSLIGDGERGGDQVTDGRPEGLALDAERQAGECGVGDREHGDGLWRRGRGRVGGGRIGGREELEVGGGNLRAGRGRGDTREQEGGKQREGEHQAAWAVHQKPPRQDAETCGK